MVSKSREICIKTIAIEKLKKEIEILETKNIDSTKKIENLDFIMKERDSYLKSYKNSLDKLNDVEYALQEYKTKAKEVQFKYMRVVEIIFETEDRDLISQLDVVISTKK